MNDGARTLLEVRDLHATYGQGMVLHGIDFEVAEGNVVTILGSNGAGKTTTLRALTGEVSTKGAIVFDGEDLTGRKTENIVRRGIAHVPQGRGTFVNFTVAENLRLGATMRNDRESIREDMQRMYDYFPVLGDRVEQRAGSLSGGEQQMLAIARGLMLHPRLLLLDEPSLGLAPMITRELFSIIENINREENTTIVLVEQNARLALELADRAYVLEAGRIVMAGTPDDVRDDEAMASAYLGYSV
ncbi:MAG: ABC transporter ATP-binding protein [Nitriliruptorales bacterium]|nr:ABC transporter ATP-binding protein [Nitriliruptorales bacterium]